MTEPTLAEIFRLAADARERDLFTSLVAVVVKFDPGTGTPPGPPTVDVLPVIKRALPVAGPGGTIQHEDLPVITNVPVVYPSAGNFSLTWPINPGDHVLLMCTNWSHQQWRETGSVAEVVDLRTHELGNAFAIAGVLPKTGVLPFAADAAVLEVDGATVTHVAVGAAAVDFVALNLKVLAEIAAVHASVAAHVHDFPAGPGTTQAPKWLPPTSEYSASADVAAAKLKSE